jgi:hypothetical protein
MSDEKKKVKCQDLLIGGAIVTILGASAILYIQMRYAGTVTYLDAPVFTARMLSGTAILGGIITMGVGSGGNGVCEYRTD